MLQAKPVTTAFRVSKQEMKTPRKCTQYLYTKTLQGGRKRPQKQDDLMSLLQASEGLF